MVWAASHTEGPNLSATYRKAIKRLGQKKAPVALGQKSLRIINKMLKEKADPIERFQPGQAA